MVGCIQGAEMHLDFIGEAGKNRRATARAEMPPGIFGGLALGGYRVLWEHRSGIEQRAMMLAAVQAVADPDPIGLPRRHDAHVAAQAATG